MNRTPTVKIELCDQCRWDSGWHFDDPDHPTRPHHDAAATKERVQRMVELAHEEQTKTARNIVRWAAETMLEFNANQLRTQFEDAGIDGPSRGPAFTWAENEGLIAPTDRTVPSMDQTTRKGIHVWRSKIHRFADREAS